MEVDLDPDALVAAAERRTGLDDLGDPTLLDRLGAQVAAVEADTGLSGLGRFLVRRRWSACWRPGCGSRTSSAATPRRSRWSSSRR